MGYAAPQQQQQQQPSSYVPNTFAAEAQSNSGTTTTTTSSIGNAAYNYGDHQSAFNINQNPSFTPAPNYANPAPSNAYGYGGGPYNNPVPQYGQQPPQQQPPSATSAGPTIFNPTNAPNAPTNAFPSQFSMLQQPMVQDMALQYGQRLADQGWCFDYHYYYYYY